MKQMWKTRGNPEFGRESRARLERRTAAWRAQNAVWAEERKFEAEGDEAASLEAHLRGVSCTDDVLQRLDLHDRGGW